MEEHMNERDAVQPKSTFVTVLAWIFITLAGFATFISIMQNIMITLMFPVKEVTQSLNSPEIQKNMPASATFMFSNIRLFFFAFLVVSSTTLISSIGLLKRRNWGRVLFIAIMLLGIAWNIFTLVFQQFVMPSMFEMPGPPESNFKAMMTVMGIFTFFMALGISILFGWIIKRLVSSKIRQEFTP